MTKESSRNLAESLIVVLVTVPDSESASKVSESLVGRRLAACVNVVSGIQSVYRWQGNIEQSPELLLIIKTKRELFADLEREILALHPYDTPEIVALSMTEVLDKYGQWVLDETASS